MDTKPFIKLEEDKQAATRKEDHIDLAFKAAVASQEADGRFYYEPMLSGLNFDQDLSQFFLGLKMDVPIWISSMTGGTAKAKVINENLARVCGEFGLGMGLGSCRQLLYEDKRMHEFDVRPLLGDQPLMINLGIAQLEELLEAEETDRIAHLIDKLSAQGLIIHINPLQEWLQPEGDRYRFAPIDTVRKLLTKVNYPVVVKEVGQGFGKESLKALLTLPIAALDLAGFGGTNFAKLELLRSSQTQFEAYKDVFNLGHTCYEMVDIINHLYDIGKDTIQCEKIIFSGGIKGFLDGYYLIQKSKLPAMYAQASGFLKHALDIEVLRDYTKKQIEGLKMASALLKIKA